LHASIQANSRDARQLEPPTALMRGGFSFTLVV